MTFRTFLGLGTLGLFAAPRSCCWARQFFCPIFVERRTRKSKCCLILNPFNQGPEMGSKALKRLRKTISLGNPRAAEVLDNAVPLLERVAIWRVQARKARVLFHRLPKNVDPPVSWIRRSHPAPEHPLRSRLRLWVRRRVAQVEHCLT